jgi:hypothetical protein
LAGHPLHIPAKAHPLNATLNQKMKNHSREPSSVLQMRRPSATALPNFDPAIPGT